MQSLFKIAAVLMAVCLAGGAWARDLVIGISQFPSNFHPSIDSMLAKSYVLGLTQRPFTVFDRRWELVCMLCTELPTFENGKAVAEEAPGGKRGVALTYTIRPDARWGDGTPVTTRDVLFTWEVGRHPKSGVGNAEMYRRMWKLDIVDERTFVIHDEKLGFNYNAINDFRVLPEHLERKVFAADPETYRNRTLFDTDPTNPGLAFGPYRIARVVPGSQIVLERNPTWWGAVPVFERIVIKAIENTTALEANLLSGEIDMIEGSAGLSLDQALAFERRHGDRFRVFYKPGLVYEHLDVMLDNPALADRRVRQALLYGLDREAMSRKLFAGRQPVADTFVHPLDWIHTDEVRRYVHDPAQAAALLDAAGWKPGQGGLRRNAAGEPLRLELMTTAGNRSRELVEQVLQSQWRQLGIEVAIKNEPPRVFFGETVSKRKFGSLALFAWISSPENPPRSTLHSQEIPSEANGWSGQNYAGFRNARMDELIDAIEGELDRDKRKALWHELQRLYAEELPALPLFFQAEAHIWPRWLSGIEPTGHMAPVTSWVENWRDARP
ncbi:peptide ABC transporter substrate-binding protein [Benzoatithermus flavus]|uniref:Peptide ABC transporter substrate-binding protein n=1 Tax=Benzoatithermus flavus TaxID=3108223 RepID=A0ABU8XM18_9PROT